MLVNLVFYLIVLVSVGCVLDPVDSCASQVLAWGSPHLQDCCSGLNHYILLLLYTTLESRAGILLEIAGFCI